MPTPDRMIKQQDELALAHLGLARALAREYRGKRLSRDDLEAEARLALVEAARTYDPAAHPDVSFESFARVLIRVRLREALYRAPVVRMGRDRERAAMRGEARAPRPHEVAIEDLGMLPPSIDDRDAIDDALRLCTADERELVDLMLRGCTVAQAGRRMGIALHRARTLFDGARRHLALAFRGRGFTMTPFAGMN